MTPLQFHRTHPAGIVLLAAGLTVLLAGLTLTIAGPVDLEPYFFLIGLVLILTADVVILIQSRQSACDRP